MNVYLVEYMQFKHGRFFSENSRFEEAENEEEAIEKTIEANTHGFFSITVEILNVKLKWRENIQ